MSPSRAMPDYEGFVLEDGQTALERVVILNEIAKSEGVELLVENMPFQNLFFSRTISLSISLRLKTLTF